MEALCAARRLAVLLDAQVTPLATHGKTLLVCTAAVLLLSRPMSSLPTYIFHAIEYIAIPLMSRGDVA
jgi:hypothetical protein